VSDVFGHKFSVLRFGGCDLFSLCGENFLEILDMCDSHSCACTWSAIVILLAVGGSCLKVSPSGGSSVNETS